VSNSVLFLLAALVLSSVGTLGVWLHGRPRRPRSSVDHYAHHLRAISMHDGLTEPPSGITPLPPGRASPASRPRSMRQDEEKQVPGT
jgi:hypothetical protein